MAIKVTEIHPKVVKPEEVEVHPKWEKWATGGLIVLLVAATMIILLWK